MEDNTQVKTPGRAAHDTWCADDDWDRLNSIERELWDLAARAAINAWKASQ